MGILSGYKKFKKYLRTADGYQLCSEWTKADSVEMADGSTLQESVSSLNEEVASLNEDITSLNGNLGNCSFSVQSDGAYVTYTPEGGADAVTKKLGSNRLKQISSTNISTVISNIAKQSSVTYKDNAVAIFLGVSAWTATGTGYFIVLSDLTSTTTYSMFYQATWGDEYNFTITVNPATRTVTTNNTYDNVVGLVRIYGIE